MKKGYLKNQNSITLVALIITIVVLFILGTISVNFAINQGLIGNTEKSRSKYMETKMEEDIKSAYFNYLNAKENLNINYTLKSALDNFNVKYESVTGNDNDGYEISVVLKDGTEKIYIIDKNENIQDYTIKWKQQEDGTITDGKEELQVGDYVNYETCIPNVTLTNNSKIIKDLTTYSGNTNENYNNPNSLTQERTIKFKVLDIQYGRIRLISDTPTESKISLRGYNGYNNSVYLLDNVCDSLYGSNKGKAQNLKVEDIEKHINGNYKSYPNSITYGEIRECLSNLYYPNIYKDEFGCKAISSIENIGKLGLSEQNKPIVGNSTANNRLRTMQTYWYSTLTSSRFTNSEVYNTLIVADSNYWISSRCVNCLNDSEDSDFCIRCIKDGNKLSCRFIYGSDNVSAIDQYSFRPVITLDNDVEIGDKVNGVWQIK